MKYAELKAVYCGSRRLVPIVFDLLLPQFLDPDGTGEAWEPTKRAKEFIGALAQVAFNWIIYDKKHPRYGEPYSGFEVSAEEIADVFGMSARQWYRGPRYNADGSLRNKPGTCAWLCHAGLLRVLSTAEARSSTWRNRHGQPLTVAEARNIYVPGPELEKLMKMHRKRVRRSRRRAVNDYKRAIQAKQLRRLEQRERRRSARSGEFSPPPGNRFQPKALVVISSPEEEITNQPTPRRSAPNAPRVHELVRVSPVGEGVGGQGRRRSRKAQAAPPADRRHDRCSAPSRNRNEPEPDGHEGPGFAAVGGELVMQRQAAPHAPGEEKPEPVASPPSGGVDELATLLATTSLLPPAPTNPDVLDPDDVVRRLIATALHRTDPERARREKLHGLPDPGELAPPRRGRQGELPGKSNEWLLAFTDEAELIAYLEREAGKRWSGWKEAHPRRRDVAARKSAAIGGALGAILGGDRTPEERAENERRREEAKRRARLMADADDDEEDGDMRDVLDEAYDDDDDDGGGE